MKVFAFGLLLLVAVVYGEALQCHNCIRATPGSGDCVETVETCPPELDNTFHKSCFKMMECLKLGVNKGLRVTCCNWDNCNV
uniref:CD59 glycoprotein-like n=1 Tax=Oncorhynchus mykiss TaxID=8022 RepID=A0A8C7QUZ8_ONCMY